VKIGDDLYVFICDMKGLCLGMGYQTQAIGTNRWDLKDPDGKLILQEFVRTVKAKGSG
jgi:signal transduction histidine kinase